MALTIVLGLTILSVANYGSTYELAGQLKPTIKPFSTLTNQHYQGDQFKSAFGYNSVPPKPFGAPFEPFKQPYQPYQPFRANYQPFGPYPGYPGPVVYPGHGGYQGPEAYRFNEPQNKPFGFQSFPAPAHPAFNQYKFGPAKKFNKNFPGLTDFNQPGKYFQEHQFGAYHGPEFSSAIVPAEHNIKQSRPKDTLLGKPFEFGLPKQTSFGFPSPPSFGYPVPNFPPVQPFVSTVPSIKSVPATLIPVNTVKAGQKFGETEVTTAAISSSSAQDDSAKVEQQSVEVTGEPLAVTPAIADAQPTSPAQEEVTSGDSSDAQVPSAEVAINNEVPTGDVANNNETPAATKPIDDGLISSSEAPINNEAPAATESVDDGLASSSEAPTDNEAPAVSIPVDGEVNAVQDSAAVAPAQEQSAAPSSEGNEPSNVGSEQTGSVPETQDSAVVQEPSPIVVSEEVKDTSDAAPAQASNEPSESSTVSGPAKSEGAVAENKPETGSAAVNSPSLPVELQSTQFGPVPISDTSSLGQFGSSGLPYFGQSVGTQQPSYYPYFDAPGFSEEELKAFAANFATNVPSQSGPVLGNSATSAENNPQGTSISNPSAEIATLIESGNNAKSQDKVASDEKQIISDSPLPSPLSDAQKTQSKFNSVQIIQNDPFNGQLPLLYDPSSAVAPLDTRKFYSHPSVSKWASQASLASYSPESAFNNFGSQFQQGGYLIEGSPTLTPLTKTVIQSSQTPLSISSVDHPLHSQIFKYSQSFVPYPGLMAGNNAAAYQPFDVSSSTSTPAAKATAADASVRSTSPPEVAVKSSSSTSAPAKKSA